jgi:two-component system OmpR family response regulator
MKPKILIVDDNANQTLVLKMHLGLKGYESVVASTITEAKTILQAQTINLIVSDIHLPDGIGSEILSSIDPIKSIAISGDTEPEQMEIAKQAGFDAYLVKPFTIEELIQTIEQLFPE